MNYEELNSELTDMRSKLEELAHEVFELWIITEDDEEKLSDLLLDLRDCLTEAADNISKWEDNEDLQEEML